MRLWYVQGALAGEPVVGPIPDEAYILEVNRGARHVSFGAANGLWGGSYGSDLRVDLPFGPSVGQFFGARLRAVVTSGASNAVGPGVELWGRGPVLVGVVRLYGGGGATWWIDTATGDGAVGAGGHMGFEFFMDKDLAFFLETGGQGSGVPGIDGASVMSGVAVYL